MDDIKPVDQVAAGGTAQPQDQGGMIDALRSRGPVPQQALANIMQPQPGPNMGSAIGSGALAGLTGNAGQNPYLAQQAQGNKDAFYQQITAQRLQDQRADRQLRQQESVLKITKDTLADLPEGDPARGPLDKQAAAIISRATGVPAGPLQASLAQGPLSKAKQAQALDMLDANVSPEMIAQATGLNPQQIQTISGIAGSESARKALGFSTRAEQRAKLAEEQTKSLDLARRTWGLTDKDPRTQFALKYAMDTYGKSFSELTRDEQKEAVEKSQVLAQKAPGSTARVKNAMAEFNPHGDIGNPNDVQVAMNLLRAKEQSNMFQKGVMMGQVTNVGRAYLGELNRFNQGIDRIGQLDLLISDMDRLVAEGKGLHLTDNPQGVNAIQQELTHLAGRPGSKGAEWYRAFDILNSRFGTVAQAVEQITGNRLAVSQTTRALGFHPKQSDPYTVQERMVKELRDASKKQRELLSANLSRTEKQYSDTAGGLGVPLTIGGHGEGEWSGEEEK